MGLIILSTTLIGDQLIVNLSSIISH